MRKSERVASWAVHPAALLGRPGPNAVCLLSEREAIGLAQPGLHRLVRGGTTSEGEAERVARGAAAHGRRAARQKAILLLAAAPESASEPDEGPAGDSGGEGPVFLPFSAPPGAASLPQRARGARLSTTTGRISSGAGRAPGRRPHRMQLPAHRDRGGRPRTRRENG